VGSHGSILGLDVLGQGYGDRRRLLALFAAALEGEAHGVSSSSTPSLGTAKRALCRIIPALLERARDWQVIDSA
jgi:hypothetical protein